jgi:hypothetical protein
MQNDPNASWSVRKATLDGDPAVIRLNDSAATRAGNPSSPFRISVAVMPFDPSRDPLESFEDRMVGLAADWAELVAVITTGGLREYVLYTGDADRIPGFHQDLKAALPDFEVHMIAAEDPRWDTYRQYAG